MISTFFEKLLGEKRLVEFFNVFPASIKSINLIEKYLHITESFDFILKTFVFMFFWPINFLISVEICWNTPKLSKQITLLFSANKTVQWVLISEYSSRFITYAVCFISRINSLE